jgi:hypothetical protein
MLRNASSIARGWVCACLLVVISGMVMCTLLHARFEAFNTPDTMNVLATSLGIKVINPPLATSKDSVVTSCKLHSASKALQKKHCESQRVQNQLQVDKQSGLESGKAAAAIQTAVNSVKTVNPAQESQNEARTEASLAHMQKEIDKLKQELKKS